MAFSTSSDTYIKPSPTCGDCYNNLLFTKQDKVHAQHGANFLLRDPSQFLAYLDDAEEGMLRFQADAEADGIILYDLPARASIECALKHLCEVCTVQLSEEI